jgi:hypothetical protein
MFGQVCDFPEGVIAVRADSIESQVEEHSLPPGQQKRNNQPGIRVYSQIVHLSY